MARFEGEAAPDGARLVLGRNTVHHPGDGAALDMHSSLRSLECQAIERTLAALGGNVSATAKALGISRNTIYRRRNDQGGALS